MNLSDLLPHKPPMVLIDQLVHYDLQALSCTCSVTITENSCFYVAGQGVPSYVGVEYMAQTIGVLSGLQQRNQSSNSISLGFLLGFNLTEQHVEWFPLGSHLHIIITHTWGEQNLMQVSGTIVDVSNGRLLTSGSLNVFSPENSQAFLQEALQ